MNARTPHASATATATITAAAAALAALVGAPGAAADPLPGQVLKFQQLPLNVGLPPSTGGAPFPGHDELSTAWPVFDPTGGQLVGYQGRFMADDFADRFDTPVVHLRWWGSYLDNQQEATVKRFLIAFERDVPAGPNQPFSRPGEVLLTQIVSLGPLAPGSGTFTEKLINAAVPEHLFEYNAELHLGKEFKQEKDTVYWLKVVALADDPNLRWGWHDRDYAIPDPLASTPPAVVPGEHLAGTIPGTGGVTIPVFHFQDDAVSGRVVLVLDPANPIMPIIDQAEFLPERYVAPFDGPAEIGEFSKDLSFEVYTVIPEPGTGGTMLALAGGLLLRRLRRRPRQ